MAAPSSTAEGCGQRSERRKRDGEQGTCTCPAVLGLGPWEGPDGTHQTGDRPRREITDVLG